MGSICKLRYECLDKSITEIHFFKEDGDEVWFCGTANPLEISWGDGDRYSTRYASSAKLNLLIENLDQRVIVEDIFNGGWVMSHLG